MQCASPSNLVSAGTWNAGRNKTMSRAGVAWDSSRNPNTAANARLWAPATSKCSPDDPTALTTFAGEQLFTFSGLPLHTFA